MDGRINKWKKKAMFIEIKLMGYMSQWIGWWENLQENPIFNGKNNGFL
jgi:hypothetical protein